MMFTCPVCQTENPQRANFCYHCGHPFQLACPRCNTRLPDAAKFCFHCGFQLSELGETELERSKKRTEVTGDQRSRPVVPLEDSVSTGLTRFIPPALASKLETARLKGEMAGERKIVTILFCDVKGSTHAAEGLDPEDWTEIINGAFEQMIAPVYQYEGIVARLMGDAILAFFGAPIAHEDDPQRAVLAGLEISSRMQQYHQQIQKRYGIDIDVRVGINTGLVVVGAVGSDLRMEYTAMGDATNLAARMEQTAEPGSVQISEATYKLVAPLFEVDEIGELQVRGKSAPVKAYRVLRRKTDPGRTRGVSRQEVRMVNREAELSSLQDILANLEHGVGRIVAVVGEAGLGKSRLIREIQSSSDRLSPDVRWFSTASLSYESGQPYGLFQRLLRRMLQIQAGEAPEVIREKIGSLHGIKQAGGLENLAIEELFGLELAKDQVWLEGEAFKRALYDALYALFQQEFTGRPGVIVFDDMHWADQASVQLLQHMFTLTEVVPLVLIFLLRPDRNVPGWALRSGAESDFHHRYTEIRLQPLSKEESHELIDRLLNIPDLSADFREAIVDRTGGNPFYIEEVVENLIESGAVAPEERELDGEKVTYWRTTRESAEIEIPENLQTLLTARLDRLDDEVRFVLQLASVLGRSFYYSVLKKLEQLSGTKPESLDRQILELVRIEIIQELARLPELEYRFRSPLTQEVAYKSILHKRRREFHRCAGEALETLFPTHREENAALIAWHYHEAQDPRALSYFTLAGDKAYKLFAIQESISHYRHALDLALESEAIETTELRRLITRLGRSLELDSQFSAALDLYEKMETLGVERGVRELELWALILQGSLLAVSSDISDPERAEVIATKALSLAQSLGDREAEAKIYWQLVLIFRLTGRENQAMEVGEKSLEIGKELGLQEQQAFVAHDLTYAYLIAKLPEKAIESARQASRLWAELGNQAMLADSLGAASFMHSLRGEFEKAIQNSDEAFEISRSIKNLWGQTFSRFGIGLAYWERGEPDQALAMMEACFRLGQQSGFAPSRIWTQSQIAFFYSQLGDLKKGMEYARQALENSDGRSVVYRPLTLAIMAGIHLMVGELQTAEDLMNEIEEISSSIKPFIVHTVLDTNFRIAYLKDEKELAIRLSLNYLEELGSYGMLAYVPKGKFNHANALSLAGEHEEARRRLEEARSAAQKMGSNWQLWQILAAIAIIDENQGDIHSSQALYQEAGAILESIAARIPTPELRATFMEKPEVIAIRGKAEEIGSL